ncbi:hypothetical protein F4803DRAFT_544504 [Xylaria telfairii]|nr:hypothetical protein F4803DRAFT_544504 [Xylaria telfairii]
MPSEILRPVERRLVARVPWKSTRWHSSYMKCYIQFFKGPSTTPPPGVVPQLDNPPNERTTAIALAAISIILATLAVAMRTYSRFFVTRSFGIPDWSILLGFSVFIGFWTSYVFCVQVAPGVHMWDLRLKDLEQFFYYVFLAAALYGPTIFLIKLSILWQYVQVFMPNRQPSGLYWTTISLIAANLTVYVVLLGLYIGSCQPVRKRWDPLVTGGHCLDSLVFNVIASAVNIVSDTAILLLPQAVIWRLNMPPRQKLAVSLIFFVAILAIASAGVRLYYAVKTMGSNDITWFTFQTGIWSQIEIDLGIIVACMPAAPAFFRAMNRFEWYSSFRRLATWKRMTSDGQKGLGYVMEGHIRSGGVHSNVQKKPRSKYYGLFRLGTVASANDTESARNLMGDHF